MTDDFSSGGGDREIPLAMFGVEAQYLEASFDEMGKQNVTEGWSVDDAGQTALCDLDVEKRNTNEQPPFARWMKGSKRCSEIKH